MRKAARAWASDGVAADYMAPWLFGPIAAAFGAVEAQGRGSLHPHILIWLLVVEFQDLLASAARSPRLSRATERMDVAGDPLSGCRPAVRGHRASKEYGGKSDN